MEKELLIKEKAKEKLQAWKALAEQLNVQLHLGIAESKDEFEKQKKHLSSLIDATNKKLRILKGISQDSAIKLKSELEELQVQATLGKADTQDAFKDQQQKMAQKIHQLRQSISEFYDSTEENVKDFAEITDEMLNNYHTRFDLFRLQFHLGKKETEQAWEHRKKEVSEVLHHIKVKIDKGSEVSEEKWDNFSKEMSEAWNHVIKAFKK